MSVGIAEHHGVTTTARRCVDCEGVEFPFIPLSLGCGYWRMAWGHLGCPNEVLQKAKLVSSGVRVRQGASLSPVRGSRYPALLWSAVEQGGRDCKLVRASVNVQSNPPRNGVAVYDHVFEPERGTAWEVHWGDRSGGSCFESAHYPSDTSK